MVSHKDERPEDHGKNKKLWRALWVARGLIGPCYAIYKIVREVIIPHL